MTHKTALIWFRQDLRLHDNPALNHAVERGYKILPLYIYDDVNAGDWQMGGASCWWAHQALHALNDSLQNTLITRRGDAVAVIQDLIQNNDIDAIFWNRCYEPWRIKRDKAIKSWLDEQSITCESFNGSLLWEPWEVLKEDGTPYKVFTPFYKKGCLERAPVPRVPLNTPDHIPYADFDDRGHIDDLGLLPTHPWHEKLTKHWAVSEDGAYKRLLEFLDNGLANYKMGRDHPAQNNVSKLSPYLHHGLISPHTVWHMARTAGLAQGVENDMGHFCSELGWREFSYSQLYHFPALPEKPLREKYAAFPWAQDDKSLEKWQRGQTGIPLVDAGMRELWETGWMHNRVRMIVASFLVKNLLIHWRNGEDWFWDCLVDADLASNAASWQWVAGSGADAAPYFRIFNPITQQEKFDPALEYVKKWVPEYGTSDYPAPIVDVKETRKKALEAYSEIK